MKRKAITKICPKCGRSFLPNENSYNVNKHIETCKSKKTFKNSDIRSMFSKCKPSCSQETLNSMELSSVTDSPLIANQDLPEVTVAAQEFENLKQINLMENEIVDAEMITDSFESVQEEKSSLSQKNYDAEENSCINENSCIFFVNDPANLCKKEFFRPEEITSVLNAPCQPSALDLKDKKFPRDKLGRCFQESWYLKQCSDGTTVKRKWLQYSPSLDKIFCISCLLFANKETRSKEWTGTGISGWKKGLWKIICHETSETHVSAMLKERCKENCAPVLPVIKEKKNEEVAINREVIRQLLDITLYLARHNLSYRGHRENWRNDEMQGNFRDLVLLLSKYSPILADYVASLRTEKNNKGKLRKKNKVTYVSWRRQNDLIDSLATCIINQVKKEIDEAHFFSVAMDGCFDKSRHEQLAFIIRYADQKSGNVYERLMDVRSVSSSTGENIFHKFVEICDSHNLNWKKDLVGQSYDGALNMRGNDKGLQSRIREINPSAQYVWCHAHRWNLVVVETLSSSLEAKTLFGNLEKLYDFITSSKNRVHLFESFQKSRYPGKQTRRFKRSNTTRWFSHADALDVVFDTYNAMLDTLEHLRDVPRATDNQGTVTAGGLYEYFFSMKFLLTASIFRNCFDLMRPLNLYFQKKDVDLVGATNIVTTVAEKFQEMRKNANETFADFMTQAKEFAETHARITGEGDDQFIEKVPELPSKCSNRIRKKTKRFEEKAQDEPITDPAENYRINTYIPLLDTIEVQIKTYFNDQSLSIMRDISLLTRKRMAEIKNNLCAIPKDAFFELCKTYSSFLKLDDLLREFKSFCCTYFDFEKALNLPEKLHSTPIIINETDISSSEDSQNEDGEREHTECESTLEEDNVEKNNTKQNSSSLIEIYKVFYLSDLKSVYPNIGTALSIAVTLPIASVTPERAFSKLNLIKTKLRSTMGEKRLSALMILSMEKDVPIDFNETIKVFASKSPLITKLLNFV